MAIEARDRTPSGIWVEGVPLNGSGVDYDGPLDIPSIHRSTTLEHPLLTATQEVRLARLIAIGKRAEASLVT